MNDSLDNTPDADDRAFRQPSARRAEVYARQPRPLVQVVKWWLVASLLLVVACVACLAIGLNNMDFLPLHVIVNGDDLSNGLTIQGVSAGASVLLAVGAVLLALLLLLLVPMVVLLGVCAVAIVLVAGLGLPLLMLGLALLVVSSPLWIVALVIWLLVRRRASPAHRASATMAA